MINEENIKKINKFITIEIVVISFLWASFVSLFVVSVFFVNDSNIIIFKIIDSVLLVLSLWITIFLSINSLAVLFTKKSIIKKLLSYKEEVFIGEIVKKDNIRTVEKGYKAREIEIKIDEHNNRIFYLDSSLLFEGIEINDIVEIKARHNFVMEIKKK